MAALRAALPLALAAPAAVADKGFVRVQGTRFLRDGKPYRFAGAVVWDGAYLGADDPGRPRADSTSSRPPASTTCGCWR